jgi:hypothetical protein
VEAFVAAAVGEIAGAIIITIKIATGQIEWGRIMEEHRRSVVSEKWCLGQGV